MADKTIEVKKPVPKKLKKRKTNPNGANQYLLDPRQDLCWGFYVDPKSDTFSNALQSAMRAGYPQATAEKITTQIWFAEKTRQMNMLSKAERNLDKTLDLPFETQVVGMFGPVFEHEEKEVKDEKTGEVKIKKIPLRDKPVMAHNPKLIKIISDVSMFVAERVGKKRYGKDGDGDKPIVVVNIINPLQKIYGVESTDGSALGKVLPSGQK